MTGSPMMFGKARRAAHMTGPAYQIVAGGVRIIADPVVRQAVADHFAKYFHGRFKTFDPQQWFEATGGLVNRKQEV